MAALVVPLTVLPSSLWRISAVTLHLPIMRDVGPDASGDLPSWMPLELYVVLLSVFSELLAFTAVGLVATWGEVFPGGFPCCVDVGCRRPWPWCRQLSARPS